MAEETRLNSDASNLPAVLAYVQGAQAPLFREIEGHVTDIMSGVERITVVPRGNQFEILVWPNRDSVQPDLSFSLDNSGTGIGQLIAILTAVVLSEQSVIVIDEINTFLHASAVKRLLGLLRTTYSHHQYIVSSHSAEVIGGSEPGRLYHITREQFTSSAIRLDLKDVSVAREIAGIFGFSMLDVFGYERIIWVEGPTEELVFPLVAEKANLAVGSEIGFCAVASASSFSNRGSGRNEIIDIYEKAGKRLAPLLKGMSFGLDRETLDDEAVASLQRSKRKLRFLSRRCIENYAIDPIAISMRLKDLGENLSPETISDALCARAGDNRYGAPGLWNGNLNHDGWLVRVDGARLLSDVFSAVTETRVEYRKTRDTVELIKIRLAKGDDDLATLTSFVDDLLTIANRDTPP